MYIVGFGFDHEHTSIMLSVLQEKRPLKRPRLGIPDVYPQEAKQKEDELNPSNVKNGFQSMQQMPEEFGTARTYNVTASKVGAYFNAIAGKCLTRRILPRSSFDICRRSVTD